MATFGSVPVRTEGELRSAVGRIVASAINSQPGYGAEIVLAAPIRLKSPITLSRKCSGLVIRGVGNVRLLAAGIDAFFVLEDTPSDITFRDFYAQRVPTQSSPGVFLEPEVGGFIKSDGSSCSNITIDRVSCFADQFVIADGLFDAWQITNCRFNGQDNAKWAIDGYLSKSTIGGNYIASSTQGVRLAGACDATAIVGNVTPGKKIDTSGSDGFNTIVGNTNTGTRTLHADDVEAGNTP